MIYCGWGYLTGKMRTADEWKWGVENYREIAEYAQRNSEADSRHRTGEPLRIALHQHGAPTRCGSSSEVGVPNVKVHLDTFHMIREEDDIRRGRARDRGAPGLRARLRESARHSGHRAGALGGVLPGAAARSATTAASPSSRSIPISRASPSCAASGASWPTRPSNWPPKGLKFLKDVYAEVHQGVATAI